MSKELVSIMVPCYNGANYLNTFFDSVLKQTYKDIELIICNDGSTDNSLEIMNSYKEKFNNESMLLKIIDKENGGQASAINFCLKEVTGKYLMWADCDDYYENDAVESLVDFLESNHDFMLVRGKARMIDYETKKIIRIDGPKYKYERNVFENYMFEQDSYCLPGVNITYTNFFDKCVKNRNIYEAEGGQNWQLLLPLMYYGETGFLDKVVYNYNIISKSHSHSINGLRNNFKRCNILKDILYHVLDEIEIMQEYDRIEYKKQVNSKYKKKKVLLLKDNFLKKNTNYIQTNKCICEDFRCTGCGACASKCPTGAIEMVRNNEGFKHPIINKNICTNCNLCTKICPVLNEESIIKNIKAYACYNNDEKDRENSSSGGLFILFAREVIIQGGVVFGACFDKNFNVVHEYAENEEDLKKFMTSKYVQSDLKDCYNKAKKFLDDDRFVYFSGTPCQIEGLLHFLGKKYNNLITQDIICHGVPSPKVWEKYLEYRIKSDKSNPLNINFRNKDHGWNSFELCINYENGLYRASHNDDLFMKSFLRDTALRNSCYNCSFKTLYRNSDITLGDFWGIERLDLCNDYDKGVSAVIINSKNGESLLKRINDKISIKEVTVDSIINYNSAMIKSSTKDIGRKLFFKNMHKYEFDELVRRYVGKKPNILIRVIRKVL